MSWLLGSSSMSFHSASSPIRLTLKPRDDAEGRREQSFLDFCREVIPPCTLHPLLFNGHLQTFWTAVKSYDIPVVYKRRIFESDSKAYPGSFAVDFVVHRPDQCPADDTLPPRTTYYDEEAFNDLESDDDRPMLIMLHGLAGGSNEIYLRSVLQPLCLDPPDSEKWEACVVNARGCAMSKITSGVLYNARATWWDVRQFVRWARNKWPRRKLFGCGFSLGANILYLGEEGSGCPLDAAIVVSNPWNLDISNAVLKSTWMGLNIYMKVMGTSMRTLWRAHEKDILKEIGGIDANKVRNVKYLYEFDRYVQCPTWGWPTEGAYYRDASSVEPLIKVQVPLLAIHAQDDPIVSNLAAPYQEIQHTKYAVMVATSGGGHLSWFEIGGGRWFARAASAWLNKMAKEADFDALRAARETRAVENGDARVGRAQTEWNAVQRKLYDNPI